VTKGRRYVCRSNLLHFNSSDLNTKHLRLSAQGFFSLVILCSSIRIMKILILLNHGKAYAIKKAIISCPEPVTQFLVLSKSLESSFGANTRFGVYFGLGLGSLEKNCWPFVLDILDYCKCSESSLALDSSYNKYPYPA
jgi:hypothetical protein